jgi:hypothetical protein
MSADDYRQRVLEDYRRRFEAGDKSILLSGLQFCIWCNMPIPAWLKRAFLNACRAGYTHEIKSWDEVFGKPLKKGQRQATARRNVKIAHEVHQRVEERHRAGEALDKALFAAVGKEFGVGGTVAAELYYETRETLHELDEIE